MTTPYRKKLIEVALPLEAINKASVRESYIYKGNPSSLHKWWAQRSLAASRVVIFASLVDDSDDPESPPAFIKACKQLPCGKNASENDTPRQRLFDFIELLVSWEAATDDELLSKAQDLIRLSVDDELPNFLDPFAGGGTIPIEAQRYRIVAVVTAQSHGMEPNFICWQ
jgi:putative DNA methylase